LKQYPAPASTSAAATTMNGLCWGSPYAKILLTPQPYNPFRFLYREGSGMTNLFHRIARSHRTLRCNRGLAIEYGLIVAQSPLRRWLVTVVANKTNMWATSQTRLTTVNVESSFFRRFFKIYFTHRP
jgi:hypothetical protein